jgi:sucrose-6-phosphate hydrolase SacC (GH32 family)
MSEFGPKNAVDGIWECPDLFEMKTNAGESKWVLGINLGRHSVAGGSGGQYLIGTFDGTEFKADDEHFVEEKEYIPSSSFLATTNSSSTETVSVQSQSLLNESFFFLDEDSKTYTSDPFTLTADYLNFSMATFAPSEDHIPNMELWIGDQLIRKSANNELNIKEWKAWNVEAYSGQTAAMKIKKTTNDSKINIIIDHIHQSNQAAYSPTETTQWMDYGTDFYAAVSWSDVPKEDGRRIWIGWMNNWHYANQIPSGKWRSSMSIPRSLELAKKGNGYVLLQQPVEEIKKHRKTIFESKEMSITAFQLELNKLKLSDQFEAEFEIDLTDTESLKMFFGDPVLPAILWEYDIQNQMVSTERLANGNEYFHPKFSNHQQFKVETESGTLKIRFFVDRTSLEIFHQNGAEVSTQLMYPISADFKWKLQSDNEDTVLYNMTIFKL